MAEFRTTGFGDAAAANLTAQRIVYVYRRAGDRWEYRAYRQAELRQRFSVCGCTEQRKAGPPLR